MRPFIALYVGGMGSREQNFYNQLVRRYGFEDAARTVQDLYLDGQARTRRWPRSRTSSSTWSRSSARATSCASGCDVYRDAGVGTLGRHAAGVRRAEERLEQLRPLAELAALRPTACGCSSARSATRARVPDDRARPRARGARPRRDAADVEALGGRTSSARACAFAPAPEYHVFPTRERPLKPYEAVVRATRDDACRWWRSVRPGRRRRRHPHARAGARRRAGRRAGRDAHPPRRPAPGAGLPAVLDRRAAAADGRRARGLAARSTASWTRGPASSGATSSTRRAGGSGCPPLDRVHGGISARAVPRRDVPAARVPARLAARGRHVVGPLLWEPPFGRRRAAAGRRAARARRAVDVAGPRPPAAARRGRGLADEPVRVLATWNRRPLRAAARRSRERAARRLGLLRADDAALRRRRLPRRARHASCARWRRAASSSCPGGRRHERERRARRLGRRRRPAAAAAVRRRGRAPGRAAGRCASRGCGVARGSWPPGPRRTTRRCAPPRWWSGSREADGEGTGLPGPGSGGPGNLAR